MSAIPKRWPAALVRISRCESSSRRVRSASVCSRQTRSWSQRMTVPSRPATNRTYASSWPARVRDEFVQYTTLLQACGPPIELLAEAELNERAAAEVLAAGAGAGSKSSDCERPGAQLGSTSTPDARPSTQWAGLTLADAVARLRRPREQLVRATSGNTSQEAAATVEADRLVLHYLLGGLEFLHPLLSSGQAALLSSLLVLSPFSSCPPLPVILWLFELNGTDQERIKWRQLQGSKLFSDPNSEIFR